MWPVPPWSSQKEWPKLDLLPHHVSRLVLNWTVPHSEEAVARFGDLLTLDGSFVSVLSYTRHRIKHHRIKSAQVGLDESTDLLISLVYEVGDATLGHISKEVEESAWLLDRLQETELASPIIAQAVFEFPAGRRFQSTVPLPLPLPRQEEYADAFEEVVGIHAVHRAGGDETASRSFTLDRNEDGGLVRALDFALLPGPAEQAPERALRRALELTERIVTTDRR